MSHIFIFKYPNLNSIIKFQVSSKFLDDTRHVKPFAINISKHRIYVMKKIHVFERVQTLTEVQRRDKARARDK